MYRAHRAVRPCAMRLPRVVFPDCPPYMAEHFDPALRALVPQLEIDLAAPTPAALARRAADCVGLMHFRTRLDREALAALRAVRVIVFLGTGVSSWVDLPAAEARGIIVRRVLGYG